MTASDREFVFLFLGLIPLVFFARLFIIVTVGWVGTVVGVFFYYTRWIWLAIGYVFANMFMVSAKITAIAIPVVGISYWIGYQQPLNWVIYIVLSVFIWWPIWAVTHFINLF